MKAIMLFIFLLPSILCTQSTWIPQTVYPNLEFNAIKFFDNSTGIVSSSGGIILKTTDSGLSWYTIKTSSDLTVRSFFFISETNGFACGDSGLILFTTNRGESWIRRNSGTTNRINSMSQLSFNYFFACAAGGELLRTTNGGLSWSKQVIAGFDLNRIQFVDANNWFVCGDSVVILKTTNSGSLWNRYKYFDNGYNFYAKDIHFTSLSEGNAVIEPWIYRTTNGGVNWFLSSGIQGQGKRIKFINSTTGYVLTYGGPVYKTMNGGVNWNYPGPENVYQSPWNDFDNTDTNIFFICGKNGHILKTDNSFSTIMHIGGLEMNFSKFSFYSLAGGVSVNSNFVLTTSNCGNKWKIHSLGSNNWFEPTFTSFRKVKFSSYSNGAVIADNSGPFTFSQLVYRSSDGGNSFYGLIGGGTYQTAIDIEAVENTVYALGRFNSTSPQIYRADAGSNWITQYTFNVSQFVSNIAFANVNTGIAAGYVNGTYQNFYARTTNGGTNWTEYPLGLTKRIRQAVMLGDGNGFILRDSGLISKTTDYGNSWETVLEQGISTFKSIFFFDIYHGYAVTNDNRLAFSSNGGSVWSLHDVSDPVRNINTVQFIDPLNGFIGGDSVLFRTTDGGLTFVNITGSNLPVKYSLSQNYPNPFNPVTNIKFSIPLSRGVSGSAGQGVFVKLIIYDLLGKEITTLINQQMQPGSYSVDWDASNFTSGVYFYSLIADDITETKKMVLVK